MTLRTNLKSDLKQLEHFLKEHDVDSYFIVVNSDNNNYWYMWNFNESPNLLLANTELSLHELKSKIVLALLKMDEKAIEHKGKLQ